MNYLYKILNTFRTSRYENIMPRLPREIWKLILGKRSISYNMPFELSYLARTCKMFHSVIKELLNEYNKSFYEDIHFFKFVKPRSILANGIEFVTQVRARDKDAKLFYSYGFLRICDGDKEP